MKNEDIMGFGQYEEEELEQDENVLTEPSEEEKDQEEAVIIDPEVVKSENNQVLKGLIAGIILSGVILQIILMWFVSDKVLFTTGLWFGVVASIFMAIHLNYSIQRMVELPEKKAGEYAQKMAFLRRGIVIAAFIVVCFFKLGNGLAMLAGMFTLRTGAYAQPLLQKLSNKIMGKGR